MIKGTAVKASLCATALLLSLSYGIKVEAATGTSDMGIAGISAILDNYYVATADEEIGEAEQLLETFAGQGDEPVNSEMTDIESPYANLGISTATNYVNIRKEPNIDSEIVGKLYNGCATDILETDGEWVKIESGNVKAGYINKEFLAIGEEAEKLINEFNSKYATINTTTLFVREKPSTDAPITTMVPLGERYYIIKETDKWAKIQIDEDTTGFVSKDYITIDVEFEYAITIEEEQEKIAKAEEARRAEAEQLEKLAKEQQEQRQAEADSKAAAENAAKANESSRNNSSSSSNSSKSGSSSNTGSSSSSSSSSNSSSSSSSTGSSIADYALKFVGNPYVWGGTSLTNGTDCSGFTSSIYSHFGYSIPRTSRDQANSAGREVSLNDLQPGDLIFYRNSSGVVNHVAMYVGGGRVVHASNAREGIKTSSYNYRTPYKARRVK